jgi:hypothetical protein
MAGTGSPLLSGEAKFSKIWETSKENLVNIYCGCEERKKVL